MLRLPAALPALLVALLAAPLAARQEAEEEPAPPGPPNVVLFLADDLGWKDVGYQGGEVATPNIDSIAEGGVRFSRFYSQHVCSPSRAALLTGRYPIRYGFQASVVRPWADFALPLDERLLSDALREAGYRTAICGKWHLGCTVPEHLPTRRGFDHQYGCYLGSIDYFDHTRMNGLDWHRDDEPLEEEGYATYLLGREAARLVRENEEEKPLFLYVPFTAVHFPIQAPDDVLDAQRKGVRIHGARRDRDDGFPAMLQAMDQAVGWVLEALEEKGMTGNTLVIFCSDNGGVPRQGSDVGSLRGKKNTVYEGGVRVPCAARWPGRLGPGATFDQVCHLVDLYPTLVRLAGGSLEQAKPVDGLDLWPALTGGGRLAREELLIHVNRDRGALLRSDGWKLVVDNWHTEGPETVELFQVFEDPGEAKDRAGEQPERVASMLARLEAYLDEAAEPLLAGERPIGFEAPAVWGPAGR